MTKIEVEVPQWAKERHLYIFAGVEPIAIYLRKPIVEGKQQDGWDKYVKTDRCNMCGKCCIMNYEDNPNWLFSYNDLEIQGQIETICGKLTTEIDSNGEKFHPCAAFGLKPWDCIILNPLTKPHPSCSIKYAKE